MEKRCQFLNKILWDKIKHMLKMCSETQKNKKGKKGEIGKLKSETTAQQIMEWYIQTH